LFENFSEKSDAVFRNRLAGFLAEFLPDVTSSGASSVRRNPAFGEIAVAQIEGWRRSYGEVSAYSTVYPEMALGAD
jgi:hypothetical protein